MNREDVDFCDGRYVKKDKYNEDLQETREIEAEHDKRISLNSYDLGGIKKVLWLIAGATIGQLVATILARLGVL